MFPEHWCSIIMCYILATDRYSKQREWDGWAHQPGLALLSLVLSSGPCAVLCVHYQ